MPDRTGFQPLSREELERERAEYEAGNLWVKRAAAEQGRAEAAEQRVRELREALAKHWCLNRQAVPPSDDPNAKNPNACPVCAALAGGSA